MFRVKNVQVEAGGGQKRAKLCQCNHWMSPNDRQNEIWIFLLLTWNNFFGSFGSLPRQGLLRTIKETRLALAKFQGCYLLADEGRAGEQAKWAIKSLVTISSMYYTCTHTTIHKPTQGAYWDASQLRPNIWLILEASKHLRKFRRNTRK